MFINYSSKRNYEVAKDKLLAKKKYLPLKAETNKLKHDLAQQDKEYEHVDSELSDLRTELGDIDRLVGNERAQVEKLIDLLRKASVATHMGANEKATKEYAHVLSTGIHSLISTMKHETSHIHKLKFLIAEVDREFKKWGHDVNKDISDIFSLEKLTSTIVKNKHGNKKLLADEKNKLKDDSIIQSLIQDLQMHLRDLHKFYNDLKHKEEHSISHSFNDKISLAEHARSKIQLGDFDSAESHLRSLHTHIQDEELLLEQIRGDDMQLKSILGSIEHIESSIADRIRLVL
jgi:hypothetical protein